MSPSTSSSFAATEVLLLRPANTGYEDGSYSIPAGHDEAGETAAQTGAREAAEEVGVRIHPSHLDFALVMHRRAEEPRIDFFFAARGWDGEIENREPEKCGELLWAPLDHLPRNVVPSKGDQPHL